MIRIIVVSSKSGNLAFSSRSGTPEVPAGLDAHPVFEVEAHEEVEALARVRRKCARNEIDPRTISWPSRQATRF